MHKPNSDINLERMSAEKHPQNIGNRRNGMMKAFFKKVLGITYTAIFS